MDKTDNDILPNDRLPTVPNQKQQGATQPALSTTDISQQLQQSLECQQKQCDELFANQQQIAKDFLDGLEEMLTTRKKRKSEKKILRRYN